MMDNPWSVFGYYPHNGQRFGDVFEASGPRAAEDLARLAAIQAGPPLLVAGVLAGRVPAVDRYTRYVDPWDARNADVEDLVNDVPELQTTQWTVLGLIVDPEDRPWTEQTGGGQRYCEQIWGLSPLAAEDVARSLVADEFGSLLVCGVFPGQAQRADDWYAKFANPDVQVG